jgi:hypothetical protein
MYPWIWQHLPFGRWGRIIGSLVLVSATVAMLWYVVFPWAEPLVLPFDDVQVGTDAPAYDVPYPTESAKPSPSR